MWEMQWWAKSKGSSRLRVSAYKQTLATLEAVTISAPRGLLKLVSLQLFSQSSLSGAELQAEIRKTSAGVWKPGPGSIYFLLDELRKGENIVELPHRGGTVRRYVISNKGKAELAKLRGEIDGEVRRQLKLLAYCCDNTSNATLAEALRKLSDAR
jgi:DNA-binding PadR family transcriptional regulator